MLMLEQPPGAPDAQTHVRIFEQAFGEIEMLERKWLLHERRLFRDASTRQPARVP
jgi:hypothetical protein